MEIKTVGIACDHAGYALKKFVVEYLESHNIPFKDYGTYSDMSCDYPDFAHALGEAITKGDVYPGIGICGSGEGMAMTLNKHKGVRAALVWTPEIAGLTRQHNDANVLVMPGIKIGGSAKECRTLLFFTHYYIIDKSDIISQAKVVIGSYREWSLL